MCIMLWCGGYRILTREFYFPQLRGSFYHHHVYKSTNNVYEGVSVKCVSFLRDLSFTRGFISVDSDWYN